MRDFIADVSPVAARYGDTLRVPGCTDEIDDEETFHMQADGFWGSEKGFHDAEQLRNERQ